MYQRHRDNSISIAISNSSSLAANPSSKTMASRQWKQFQREFYSFVFSTLGKSIILVGIIFGFYFILSIIAMWSTYMTGENVITKTMSMSAISPFCSHCSERDYKDNIKNINMEGLMCYEPMDVVYTWVNGNDPQLQSDINIYKRQHEIEEHLKKDPNWTQPIGIKFNLILNGGTRTKWKNELFDIIKDELTMQLEIIMREHKELIVLRPNKTVIVTQHNVSSDIMDSNHSNETQNIRNVSIENIAQNIAALNKLAMDTNEDIEDELTDDDMEEYAINDDERRLLSMDNNNDNDVDSEKKKTKNKKKIKKKKKKQKQNAVTTKEHVIDEQAVNQIQDDDDAYNKLSNNAVNKTDDNTLNKIDDALNDQIYAVNNEVDEDIDQIVDDPDTNKDDNEDLDDALDDDLDEDLDEDLDDEYLDDNDNDINDDEYNLVDINMTNATNTSITTQAPFKFIQFWTQIKLRFVQDYDATNAFCYNEEELKQILWDKKHAPNATNITANLNETNATQNNQTNITSIEIEEEENKKSKLIEIAQDKEDKTHINDTLNLKNGSISYTNVTLNDTETVVSVLNMTTNITTTEAPNIIQRSYCIELEIEIIHKDTFGANQTWPFMEILQNNATHWNNFTQNVNKKLKKADYDESYYNTGIKPKAIHKLFPFNAFVLYPNQTINITKTNVSEVDAGGLGRYRDNEELRYSLRSIWQFAPWIRNIYIVTNGQVPSWLNLDHDNIWIVTHDDIFQNKSHLPTFASPSIEANIHRIPGLSKRFLYLNDDVMFGNDIYPDDFWKMDGTQYFFPSWEPPKCSEGCPNNWLHDGYCDSACNNVECDWDSGDCLDANGTNTGASSGGSGSKGSEKTEDRYCTSGCPVTWVGDKVCDRACQHKDCAYDGGDCGLKMMKDNDVYGIELDPETANGSVIELERDIMTFYIDFGKIFKRKEEDPKETTKAAEDAITTPETDINDQNAPTHSPTASPTLQADENKIKTAQHDHKDMVRTAIITQAEKILAVILHPHDHIDEEEEVIFDISGVLNGDEVHYVFTIRRDAPEKKLNAGTVKKRMDVILKDMNGTEIRWIVVKETLDPDPKAMKQVYEWNNDTVSDIEALWERIETETKKQKDTGIKLKSAVYEKIFILAGNNTKWMIESDLRLNNTLMSGYMLWLKGELENKLKEKESLSNGTAANEYKAKQPTLPPYLFDEEFMYKYDDFFVGDEKYDGEDKYDYNQYNDYYDDYNQFDDMDKYEGEQNRRRLLGMRAYDMDKYIAIEDIKEKGLNSWDRLKMIQRQKLNADEDYNIMMELGLIDDRAHWLHSKAERDWLFLNDFKQNVLYDDTDNDEEHPLLDDMIHVDGYINEIEEKLIVNDAKQNAKLKQLKQKSMQKIHEEDLLQIQRKLERVFDRNSMDIFPWIMHDLSLYIFYEKGLQTNVKHNGRKLLDTFGESLRFVTRVLNKHFGVDTRYVPAHMAHAIDREILIELVDRFSTEYTSTSSHRFRSGSDMQWSFSYFYYMMSVKYNFTDIDVIYKEWLDINGDGILNNYELERMINDILIGEAQRDSSDGMSSANDTIWRDFFHKALWNITRQLHDLTYWHPLQITVYSINYTTIIRDYLLKHFNNKKKFRFAKRELHDVEFYMIKDEPNEVRDRLKHMYSKKPKFMCLNDDLPHDRDPSNETLFVLDSFLKKYYPFSSPFEINDKSEYHPYLRRDEMILNGYWKKEWNLQNSKHYKVYNDRFETKIAQKNNFYKKNKLQMYYDHHKQSQNKILNKGRNVFNKQKQYASIESADDQNYSYHINQDMPYPGEAFGKKEQIRTVFYQTIVRRFREFHWLFQFIALFIFCSIVVTIFLKIVDIIWYYLTISASWLFTNNPRLFACCQWISFKSWFGRSSSDSHHND